jgi:hypothetical protein
LHKEGTSGEYGVEAAYQRLRYTSIVVNMPRINACTKLRSDKDGDGRLTGPDRVMRVFGGLPAADSAVGGLPYMFACYRGVAAAHRHPPTRVVSVAEASYQLGVHTCQQHAA